MATSTIVLLVILAIVIIYPIVIYNKLVTLKNRFKNGFSQIDVQLQRRYDLIPNLVETAKGYMKHEAETLESVVQARNHAHSAEQALANKPDDPALMKKFVAAEGALTSKLGGFFALSERYPDLKANQTMQQLMEELSTTENRIGFARQAFNDAVMAFNTYKEQFPNSIIANLLAFKHAEHFEVDNVEAKKPVKVKF